MRQFFPILCLAVGLFTLALAALLAPSLLLQPPVADWNLVGRFPIITSGEIQGVRVILALAGVGLCAGAGVWISSPHALWRSRIEADYAAYLAQSPPSPPGLSRFLGFWSVMIFLVMLSLIQSLQWSHAYHYKGVGWYDALTMESGFFETLTAVTLLIAGIIFLVSANRFQGRFDLAVARWPPLLLGVLLIVGAGEEVSWGQHWLHFATPQALQALNDQQEFNLHNINTHWANHLMVLFFLIYVGLLPLAVHLFSEIRYAVERLNVPLCPIVFAPFAFVGVSMSEAFPQLWGNPLWSPNEARETLFGLVMMGASIAFYLLRKSRASDTLRRRDD